MDPRRYPGGTKRFIGGSYKSGTQAVPGGTRRYHYSHVFDQAVPRRYQAVPHLYWRYRAPRLGFIIIPWVGRGVAGAGELAEAAQKQMLLALYSRIVSRWGGPSYHCCMLAVHTQSVQTLEASKKREKPCRSLMSLLSAAGDGQL